MSFSVVRSLSRLLPRTIVLQNASRAYQSSSVSSLAAIHGQRAFTRSLWHLGRVGAVKPCGCCGLHTEGDKEFSDFLKDEIKYEQEHEQTSKDLPKVNGFEVAKSDGAEVVLTKKMDGEVISVRFSVNNSVDNDMEFDEQEKPKGADEELLSRPVFTVEMNRGNETFHVQCSFQPPEMMEATEGDEQDLPFDIQEVTLLKNGAEWEPTDYVVAGSNMDGNMYDMILNMMEERGLDAKFAEEIVKFATSYEHKQYISFLDRLKDFVGC